MQAIYTIGHTKTSLRDFVGRLKGAQVDCVVDVRLNNTSQLAGFAKRDDLKFLLEEGFGIRYAHMLELAPSQEMLDNYKSDKDWEDYKQAYSLLIDRRRMVDVFLEAAEDYGWERPCLLCSEDTSDNCHRRLLADAIQQEVDGLEVTHL